MECKDFEPSIIQENKILKLCKRLKNCTLNEIVQFLEVEQSIIETTILYLEQEDLICIDNGIITIADKKSTSKCEQKNLSLMFQFQSDEKIEYILQGFCLNIPPQKLCYLLEISNSCLCNYYAIFRKMIYERQFKELLKQFFNKPQEGRYRKFYEKYAYFYVYNNKVYVSEKLLRATLEKGYTKEEVREFKRMYCYLARVESHNINENYMYYRLAESIWRREKSFEELYSDLKNNLIS